MNTNTKTSTNPANPATSVPDSNGSAVGNKFKGVVEVVHGAGDALRGTVMGALDTMTHQGETKNDEIAQKGRLEMERGFAHIRGSKNQEGSFAIGSATGTVPVAPPAFSGPSTNAKLATTGGVPGEKEHPQAGYIPGAGGALAEPPVQAPIHAGAENPQSTTIHGSGVPNPNPNTVNVGAPQMVEDNVYPSHHRDDAISEVPPNQHPVANVNYQGQNQTVGSEYDPSQAPYRNEVRPADFSDAKVEPKGNESVGLPTSGAVTGAYQAPPPTGPFN